MSILILGGGVSGLSSAWYLQKRYPNAKISLLEKSSRLGGWIKTVKKDGAYLEMGPRTFAVSRSSHLLQLIEELGLKDRILFSNPTASKRFLWHRGALRPARSFMPRVILGLIREMFIAKKMKEDESIHAYAKRRLNAKIADTILDPMTLGIYAGDIQKLSLRSCFPFLYEWEQKGCSLLRGLIQSKKEARLFTLKQGVGSLVEAMEKQLDVDIHLNCPVDAIAKDGVYAQGQFWKADKIISALPLRELSRLTKSLDDFPSQSIWVVNFCFKEDVLKQKGFGYLVPTKEKESVLGMIWDSAIFQRETGAYKTVVTVMVRNLGDQAWAEEESKSAMHRHLGHFDLPDYVEANLAEQAIPQFEVGYSKRFERFQLHLKETFPNLAITGNYIDGVSVDACIRSAKFILKEGCDKEVG